MTKSVKECLSCEEEDPDGDWFSSWKPGDVVRSNISDWHLKMVLVVARHKRSKYSGWMFVRDGDGGGWDKVDWVKDIYLDRIYWDLEVGPGEL